MEWKVIKPDVFAAIMDFFTSGLPVVNEDSRPSADTGQDFSPLLRTIFRTCNAVFQSESQKSPISISIFSSIRWWWWSSCNDQRVTGHSNTVMVYEHSDIVCSTGFLSFRHNWGCCYSPDQQCRRMEEMFSIVGLRMALLNWSCRVLAPVVPVPLLLWRVESKTCCSFTYLKLNQWSRFVSLFVYMFVSSAQTNYTQANKEKKTTVQNAITSNLKKIHLKLLTYKYICIIFFSNRSKMMKKKRQLKFELLEPEQHLHIPLSPLFTWFNSSHRCNKKTYCTSILQLCEITDHCYSSRCYIDFNSCVQCNHSIS